MARLFISYRRDDDGVLFIKERLKQAHYAVWFDTDNIRLGDPDWQASIARGIESSDAMVLCFSPRVLESEPIRYEIRTARSKNKMIFILVVQPFEKVYPSEADLLKMGLSERYQVMDFTRKDRLEENTARFISDLYAQGIRPTPHELRQRKQEDLHEQRYLVHRIDEVGKIELNQVNPDYVGNNPFIEDLYVPVPSDRRLVLAIDNYEVERWWLCCRDLFEEEGITHHRLTAAQREALDAAHAEIMAEGEWNLGLIEILVEERREQLFREKEEGRRSRMARLDRAYQVIALDTVQVTVMSRYLLLLGEAGSGKTTFSDYLTVCLAGELLPDYQRRLNHAALGRWTHGLLTPVDIKMHWLMDYINQHGWGAAAVEAYIRERLLKDNPSYWADLQRDLKEGFGIIIIDGLERALQVPPFKLDERHRQLNNLLGSIFTHFDKCRLLMTGRPEYFVNWKPQRISIAHLDRLPVRDRTQMAARIFENRRGTPPTVEETQQFTTFLSQFSQELRGNPRFITLLSTVYPAPRGVLYRHTIDLLLDNWTKPNPRLPSIMDIFQHADLSVAEAEKILIETLGKVVYETVDRFSDHSPTGDILRNSMLQHLGDLGFYYDVNPERVRAYLSENAGVLVGSGDNFRFAHEDFRQYFLAEHLLKEMERREQQSDDPAAIPLARDLIYSRPNIWAGPLEMIADLLVDSDHGGTHRVWNLLEDLLGDVPPGEPDAPTATDHAEVVWLAARIAINQLVGKGRLRPTERAVLTNLVSWLVALVETPDVLVHAGDVPGVCDGKRRAEVGRMLGTLGDPRSGISLPVGWVDIPAGKVILGGSYSADPYTALDDPQPEQMEVPAFRIARYPVTYAQYAAFVNANGYEQKIYWIDGQDASGWEWGQGHHHPAIGWQDPAWHIPNHPVIGISWYEAAAFCRWLSAQTGNAIRLPTVAEWVRAARGDSAQLFPYGDAFDSAAANTHAARIGRTTAVGLFPTDASAAGVVDLSGNVYEWCQDIVIEQRLDNTELVQRVLMGGSWRSYPGFCRINARYSDNPASATTYWGFRVVMTPGQ